MSTWEEEQHERDMRKHEERLKEQKLTHEKELARIREDTAREQFRKVKLENDEREQRLKAARRAADNKEHEQFWQRLERKRAFFRDKNPNGNRR